MRLFAELGALLLWFCSEDVDTTKDFIDELNDDNGGEGLLALNEMLLLLLEFVGLVRLLLLFCGDSEEELWNDDNERNGRLHEFLGVPGNAGNGEGNPIFIGEGKDTGWILVGIGDGSGRFGIGINSSTEIGLSRW